MWKTYNKFLILIVIPMIIGNLSGCSGCSKSQQEAKVTMVVLFDISGSTKPMRKIYCEGFKKIVDEITHGDAIVVTTISSASIDESEYIVNEALPELEPYSFKKDNERSFKKKRKEADNVLQQKKDEIFKTVTASISTQECGTTDILSSLHIAEQIFNAYPQNKKILVIFSDMQETLQYNFSRMELTDDKIKEIINKEKDKKSFPNLSGTEVYVIGATGSTDKYLTIQNCWISYFKECGATLSKKTYCKKLLSFSLQRDIKTSKPPITPEVTPTPTPVPVADPGRNLKPDNGRENPPVVVHPVVPPVPPVVVPPVDEGEIEQLYQSALTARDDNDCTKAIDLFKQVLEKINSSRSNTYFEPSVWNLVVLNYKIGQYDRVMEIIENNNLSRDGYGYYYRGLAHYKKGEELRRGRSNTNAVEEYTKACSNLEKVCSRDFVKITGVDFPSKNECKKDANYNEAKALYYTYKIGDFSKEDKVIAWRKAFKKVEAIYNSGERLIKPQYDGLLSEPEAVAFRSLEKREGGD